MIFDFSVGSFWDHSAYHQNLLLDLCWRSFLKVIKGPHGTKPQLGVCHTHCTIFLISTVQFFRTFFLLVIFIKYPFLEVALLFSHRNLQHHQIYRINTLCETALFYFILFHLEFIPYFCHYYLNISSNMPSTSRYRVHSLK